MIVDSDSIRLLYIVLFVHPVETGGIFDAFLMGFDGAGDGAGSLMSFLSYTLGFIIQV